MSRSKFIEAVHSDAGGNHGKFEITVWDYADFQYKSAVDGTSLLGQRYSPWHVKVTDIETQEGLIVRLGGSARNDLMKHKVWVCPLFEYFLTWLYEQPREKVRRLDLPDLVYLPDVPFAMAGYRRGGPRAYWFHLNTQERGGWMAARTFQGAARARSRRSSARTTGTWRRPARGRRSGYGSPRSWRGR